MKIEVLGTGCKRCDQLYENTLSAVSKVNSLCKIDVEKIGDINYFVKKGVFLTPGLMIDDELVSTGKVLESKDIIKVIMEKL